MADTMVEGSKSVGRDVPVTIKPQGQDAVPGDYHDYDGVKSMADGETYSKRQAALTEALGNKDSVKG